MSSGARRYAGGAEWESRLGSRWVSTICGLPIEIRPGTRGIGGWTAWLGDPNGNHPGPSLLCSGAQLRETMVKASEATYRFVTTLKLVIGGTS